MGRIQSSHHPRVRVLVPLLEHDQVQRLVRVLVPLLEHDQVQRLVRVLVPLLEHDQILTAGEIGWAIEMEVSWRSTHAQGPREQAVMTVRARDRVPWR